ncbi:tyrosine-type recombinase/integrase [Tenacibaculum mesophilum]|uniref:Tyrosine-type recombinase/integrase n=1 Tax=Tenacibaculum mesophilum TaxID=104268 RepID=A0AAE9MPI4_9FLAO|nr:tyrosine-type recombinase/integrase [Tenacibaculum mesophilum]UTD15413.1 tyrosine-type recombinase/integrase [Tenacibaculum mesophilum]
MNLPVNYHEKGKFYLTQTEVISLMNGAKKSRYSIRNRLIILMMYRHGLRVSELINLKIKNINFNTNRIWIQRLKNSLSVEHPIKGDEIRAIKRYLRLRKDNIPYLFINERKEQFTRKAINYIIKFAAKNTELDHVNPHMLRHSCGYYLANKGYDLRLIQDYLGHRDPKHTVIYTQIAGNRFEDLW